MNHYIAKTCFAIGAFFIAIGILFLFRDKLPFLGRLPGDVCIQKKNVTLYFPISTCLIMSAVLSFVIWLFFRR
ncbi:MAG: DUF2905 domain-containing protein [Candidatus Omnitrophica bacterium]|nr:DUF2905 domain-containing protein [Candidatus Omnitrophota bacterium]